MIIVIFISISLMIHIKDMFMFEMLMHAYITMQCGQEDMYIGALLYTSKTSYKYWHFYNVSQSNTTT